MPDDPDKRGPHDRIRISINQWHERTRWARKFGVTQAVLREACKAVGPMTADVKRWLIKRIENA